ncbi:MAG: Na+-transporting methylmalonyl-CoA/oxaloacetate decarboxylase gamma subunit [Enterobacterales bacterium]|jgi:Na+-transporting methylmalonyl-CoA/oxaloacetate decarboxylase gamma subunit
MNIESMIFEGLYLMMIGMGFVISFLTLLVVILTLLEKFVVNQNDSSIKTSTLTAVITAAIQQHRKI